MKLKRQLSPTLSRGRKSRKTFSTPGRKGGKGKSYEKKGDRLCAREGVQPGKKKAGLTNSKTAENVMRHSP